MSYSLTLEPSNAPSHQIKNLTRNFKAIVSEQDWSVSETDESRNELISDYESSYLVTSYTQESLYQLLNERSEKVEQRNAILFNFFKRILPQYRKKLRAIEKDIENIELKIDAAQDNIGATELQIKEILDAAENSVSKFSKYLDK